MLTSTQPSTTAPSPGPVTGAPMPVVRFQRPLLPALDDVARYFRAAEERRWYSNGGPCAELLSQRLGEHLGGLHVVPVANCTIGLMVALAATVGPRRGPDGPDLIVTPSYTFAAAASAISWLGYTPLLVDVDAATWQLDPRRFAGATAAHGGRIAGVLGTSTFGCPAPVAHVAAWRTWAGELGVPLVVDSAAGFGAVDEHGRPLGAQGDVEVFSFHATKPFATGEGGIVTTTSADLAERVGRLVNFGFDPDRTVTEALGLNGKMSELQAAVCLAMLDAYPDALAARRARAHAIVDRLSRLGFVTQAGYALGTWQAVPLLAPSRRERDGIIARAAAQGVELRAYFDRPLHRHPAYAGAPRADRLEITDGLADRCLSLPMAVDLTVDEIDRIVRAVAG